MKNNLKKTVILAVIGAALALQGAQAQITASPGDLIFGAETINSGVAAGTNLEVDLGSISNFTTTATLSFANVSSTDLGSVLGSGYATASNDFFSVAGTNALAVDIGSYNKGAVFLTLSADPGAQSKTTLGSTIYDITGVYNGLAQTASGAVTTAPNGNGKGGEILASNSGSFSTWEQSTSATTFFGLQNGGETSFGSGASLNLYALNTAGDLTSQRNTPGTDTLLGTFSYNTANGLIFTGADVSAAPEPSTYVLVFVGIATLFVINRRRSLNI
jgi:hypothetical protein